MRVAPLRLERTAVGDRLVDRAIFGRRRVRGAGRERDGVTKLSHTARRERGEGQYATGRAVRSGVELGVGVDAVAKGRVRLLL